MRNILMLFPVRGVRIGKWDVICAVFYLLLLIGSGIYIVVKQRKTGVALIILAAVPYLRYAVLYKHSSIHYFFTFRAQMPAVFLICYVWAAYIKHKKKEGRQICGKRV